MSSDIIRRKINVEDLETLFNKLQKLRYQESPTIIYVEGVSERKEEETFNVKKRIYNLESDIQTIQNQLNKFLKVEIREESVYQFRELISTIDNVNEVYIQHISDGIVFWIFYDRGDRVDVLEKIVDIECEFENLYRNLNFDYRILPYSLINSRIIALGELIYRRE